MIDFRHIQGHYRFQGVEQLFKILVFIIKTLQCQGLLNIYFFQT